MANTGIDRYGVIGYPVSHSRSPVIHRLFALQTGQELQYELLQVLPDKLESAIRQFQNTGGRGLNITLPHKSEAVRLVDQLSERAKSAGAINTLAFQDNVIVGDNTDGIGLMRDLITTDPSLSALRDWEPVREMVTDRLLARRYCTGYLSGAHAPRSSCISTAAVSSASLTDFWSDR